MRLRDIHSMALHALGKNKVQTALTMLERRFDAVASRLEPAGRLWIAWPKKASNIATDLSFALVQGLGLDHGMVDNKTASVTDAYQGCQFVYRLKDRPSIR